MAGLFLDHQSQIRSDYSDFIIGFLHFALEQALVSLLGQAVVDHLVGSQHNDGLGGRAIDVFRQFNH